MGKYDSSKTRVQPVFEQLLEPDPNKTNWLARLLDFAGAKSQTPSKQLALRLACNPGTIYKHPKGFFERRVAPPEAFLKWLIQNPASQMPAKSTFSQGTLARREAWIGLNGADAQSAAMNEALSELAKNGTNGSRRKWWAFEGFTAVDCLIETDQLVLFIEGKRTEVLSSSTAWYPKRNQLARNLETAREMAAGQKEYGVLLVTEQPISIGYNVLDRGWPHLSKSAKEELGNHFIGNLIWQDVCSVTNVNYTALPNTVP